MDVKINGHFNHFRWCPSQEKERGARKCLCEATIYAVVALIGGVIAALEFWGAHIAEAVSPKADAFHGANDTASNLVAIAVVVFATLATREMARTVRRYGAYAQIALLVLAAVFIAVEIVQKILSPNAPDALMMIAIGALTALGNGAGLSVLNMSRGEWTINRRIQDRHVRIDLYYSIGVAGAGVLILITGWLWWDAFVAALIFLVLCRMIILLLRGASS